jgi:hypothetical protein
MNDVDIIASIRPTHRMLVFYFKEKVLLKNYDCLLCEHIGVKFLLAVHFMAISTCLNFSFPYQQFFNDAEEARTSQGHSYVRSIVINCFTSVCVWNRSRRCIFDFG